MGRALRAWLLFAQCCALSLLLTRPLAAQAPEFVTVADGQLVLGGAPFRFVGANASVIHGRNERRDYEQLLDAMRDDGLTVVRVWALGEQNAPGQAHHPLYAFRIGADGWVEDSFVQLDRVLVAARARGLRVILVLANRWKDYGGIATYGDWAGRPLPRDASGEPTATQLSAFYACGPCELLYRAHVERVVGRVNSLTGVAYRDDPTVLAWELINEASAVTAADEDTLLSWVEAQARFIRSHDPRHLISAGHIGYANAHEREIWRRVQALPEVDFADAHAYPLSDPRVSSPARLARWIDDRVALAAALHKPLVFGEFGFERRLGPARARFTRLFLAQAELRGAAGALIWHYTPGANGLGPHSISEDPRDSHSRQLRRVLSQAARAFRSPARAFPAAAARPFAFSQTLRSTGRVHDRWSRVDERARLDIDPLAFAQARFERVGTYREAALELVYGAGPGFVEYRFASPAGTPSALTVEARLSSELPGAGLGQDFRDGSDVDIELDGEVLGTVRAKPDDGLGELVRLEWRDARSLRRIFQRRKHTLRFTALPSRHAGGLCVYGRATGVLPLDPSARRDVDQVRIELRP